MPTDFRTELAASTRAAHQRVERVFGLEDIAPVERYHAYLQIMHALLHAVEDDLARDARLQAAGFDLVSRRKLPWLEMDLRHFGLAPRRPLESPLPGPASARIGWAYVLEGATLGGRVLYRRLAPRLSLAPDRGAAFLFGYGERTGAMWSAFVERLNALRLDEAQRAQCIEGANAAFDCIAALSPPRARARPA
jgi:heme oxygenase